LRGSAEPVLVDDAALRDLISLLVEDFSWDSSGERYRAEFVDWRGGREGDQAKEEEAEGDECLCEVCLIHDEVEADVTINLMCP